MVLFSVPYYIKIEMINGKLVLGQIKKWNKFKETGYFRINNEILLLNLKGMRIKIFEEKVFQLIKTKTKFRYHEQTIMNDYLKDYIGHYPIEYHIRNFRDSIEIKGFNEISGNIHDKDVLYFASKFLFHY